MSNDTNAAAAAFLQDAEHDAQQSVKDALPQLRKDLGPVADAVIAALGNVGDDVLNVAKDIGQHTFADAKNSAQQLVAKLPGPLPFLLQAVAANSEQVIDALGNEAFSQLQAREKATVANLAAICGKALASAEALFTRKLS